MVRRNHSNVYYPGIQLSLDGNLVFYKRSLNLYLTSKVGEQDFGQNFQLCPTDGIIFNYITYHGNMAPHLIALHDFLITEKIPTKLM